jgi:DNA-binding transcriptional LysR family regulator
LDGRDLGLLLTLDALLQEVSVTRAARRLGLSTPGCSHALARIRRRLGDPILVRAGRRMALTPRGEQLRPHVRSLVEQASRVLRTPGPFVPGTLARPFTVFVTDHALLVLGDAVDRLVRHEAPEVTLRFLPAVADDWIALRDGIGDLSVGLPGPFPPEFRARRLLSEPFVCVVRRGHPRVRSRLTLPQYLALDHLAVTASSRPCQVDAALVARGYERRVRRTLPHFGAALRMVARTDYVLTLSKSAAAMAAGTHDLRIVSIPLPLEPSAVHLLWHARLDNEPAHAWLRDVFVRAAESTAPAASSKTAAPGATARASKRKR